MATIEAGLAPKTSQEYIIELYEFTGVEGFPVSLQVANDGKLLNISVETEWKTGGTTPVEETSVINENGEKIYTEYAENYEEHSLSNNEIAKVNEYIALNLEDS